jgi:GT2 family glycosyltransferase
MKNERVDIIIINWNGKVFLSECLDAIFKQSYQDINVIVVDNNSSDGSVAYLSEHFPTVNVIPLDDNYGFVGANNRGITASSGRYVALINNDAVAQPDWIRESIECLNRYPDAGFCAPKILLYGQRDILDSAGDNFSCEGVGIHRGSGQKGDAYDECEYVFGACAAAAVYRREMLDEIGSFDEDFFIMCEDIDLSFRAQLSGYRCVYCPSAVVYHKDHGTIKGLTYVFSYYGQRNLEYVYIKNMPALLLLWTLPAHLMYDTLMLFYCLIKGRILSFVRAKFSVLRHLPRIMKKRRYLQENRKVSSRYLSKFVTNNMIFKRIKSVISAGNS